jgi:hypothetical protein
MGLGLKDSKNRKVTCTRADLEKVKELVIQLE